MKINKGIAAIVLAGVAGFGLVTPGDAAEAAAKIPGMTEAQTTESAYRAYQDYYGKNNSCRIDFLESYNGVQRDSKKADPEMRDQVVKLTTKKARKLNAGKRVWILKPLDKYRGGCQFERKWRAKGYKPGSKSLNAALKNEGYKVPVMFKTDGDTAWVITRDGKRVVS